MNILRMRSYDRIQAAGDERNGPLMVVFSLRVSAPLRIETDPCLRAKE